MTFCLETVPSKAVLSDLVEQFLDIGQAPVPPCRPLITEIDFDFGLLLRQAETPFGIQLDADQIFLGKESRLVFATPFPVPVINRTVVAADFGTSERSVPVVVVDEPLSVLLS